MKVSLISYTGHGNPDPWYAARLLIYTKNTRLKQGDETRAKIAAMSPDDMLPELDYIANTIRSSWEFVRFTVEINDVTRAFTHQWVRTRTMSHAQEAQRVADMAAFDTLLPETVKNIDGGERWASLMAATGDVYRFYEQRGVPRQDCRGVLPTNVLTSIISEVNLRTLADLVAKRSNPRAQGEYQDVMAAIEAQVYEVMPWTKPFLRPARTSTPALDAILKWVLGDDTPVGKKVDVGGGRMIDLNDALKEVDGLKATWG